MLQGPFVLLRLSAQVCRVHRSLLLRPMLMQGDGAAVGQFVKGFATIDDVSLINVEVCFCCTGLHCSDPCSTARNLTCASMFIVKHCPTRCARMMQSLAGGAGNIGCFRSRLQRRHYLTQGTGMVGVVGTASDIFGSVREAGVNVIMISQARRDARTARSTALIKLQHTSRKHTAVSPKIPRHKGANPPTGGNQVWVTGSD